MSEGILEVGEVAGDRVVELRDVGEYHGVGLKTCEVEGVVQGDEGPICGVAQVLGCHGVTVSHQEEGQEEEVENREKEKVKWKRRQDKCERHEPCGLMNDQTKTCRCAQFCMLRRSMCVASFLLLSTIVSMMLKVYLSLYTLLRSHLFVNCCIRRYSVHNSSTESTNSTSLIHCIASS